MLDYFRNLWDQSVSFWTDLNSRQQVIFTSIVAVTLLVVSGLLYWSLQPQWVVLFNRDLSISEASKIASRLEDMGIEYRVEGNIIRVPFSRVHRIRLRLAEEGIQPRSTVGFEIFEKGSIGITDFERQVRYKRALQGELRQTIRANPKIKDASVNIAMPRRKAIFKEDEKPVKASVKLELKPYASLDNKSIQGIINLVSYGVVGLKPKNIVVTDQHDRVLSDQVKEEGGLTTKSIKQLQVRSRVEDKLEKKLRSSLGQVLTRDRISVAVTAEMDFDRIEKRLEQYRMPEGAFEQLKASEKRTQKHLEGKNLQPGGPAGSESNIPTGEEVKGKPTVYDETSSVVNYFADKNVTKIVKDPAVERISSVVTVDGTYKQVTENGTTKFEYKPPSEEQMNKIRRLARAAVGFSKKRGDQIEVTTLQFDRSEEIRERRREQQQAEFRRQVAYFVAGALALTLLIGGGLYWLRSRGGTTAEPAPATQPEVEGRDLMSEVSVEEMEREETLERIEEAAEENPEAVAQILRTWFTAEST